MANVTLHVRFGPFVLDRREMCLTKHGEPVPLTPKAIRVLDVLLGRAGELVTKEALIAEVWPRASISDAALAKRLSELRVALDDDAREPRYIRTEYRRGLRFIGEVATTGETRGASLIGRAAALASLDAAFAGVTRHDRHIVFVSGAAGMGKTRLLQHFLAMRHRPGVLLGIGHCIQHSEGQPYLAVEALLQDLRESDRTGHLVQALERHAPSWNGAPDANATAAGPAAGAERRRRLLELSTALERAARDRVVILAIEDLHWADPSTLAFLDYLSRRLTPARLMLVATLRDTTADLEGFGLEQFLTDRLGRDGCTEIRLEGFRADDVRSYLAERFDEAVAAALADFVHERTGGLPLFVSWLADDLVERRDLEHAGGGWRLERSPDDVASGLPESLHRLLEMQLGALSASCRAFLEVGSVIGRAFDLATVADVMGERQERIESVCRETLRSGLVLRRVDAIDDPRYAFCHDLLRSALHTRLSAERRKTIHSAYADHLSRREAAEPAELALHWQEAGNGENAGASHLEAGRRALAKHAHVEATRHFESAAELLDGRAGFEKAALDALLEWGSSLVTSAGYTHPRVRTVYARACERVEGSPDSPRRFAAAHGLRRYHVMCGELAAAAACEPAMLEAMQATDDPLIRARGHADIGERLHYSGEQVAARRELAAACRLCEMTNRDPLAQMTWADVLVGAQGNLALVECELGCGDSGRDRIERLLRQLERRPHPYSLVLAHQFASRVHLVRRDDDACRGHADALLRGAAEHGFADLAIWGNVVRGHLEARQGSVEAGVRLLRAGVDGLHASGTLLSRSGVLQLLAAALARRGAHAEALECLDASSALIERTGEHSRYPSLHATRARVLAVTPHAGLDEVSNALERCHESSLRYESRIWQLRAATMLAKLAGQGQGSRALAGDRLAEAIERCPEGREMPDHREAFAASGELGLEVNL